MMTNQIVEQSQTRDVSGEGPCRLPVTKPAPTAAARLSVEVDGPDVGGWPLDVPRKLWFDFLSAAYASGIEEQEALEYALERFIVTARRSPD